jgi:hypothetical protein
MAEPPDLDHGKRLKAARLPHPSTIPPRQKRGKAAVTLDDTPVKIRGESLHPLLWPRPRVGHDRVWHRNAGLYLPIAANTHDGPRPVPPPEPLPPAERGDPMMLRGDFSASD